MTQLITRATHTIDATDKILGRLASEVVTILRGKNKPSYQPYLDCGDRVVIKNIRYIRVTGKKETKKIYRHNTGYPGGVRTKILRDIKQSDPAELFRMTIYSMLPDNLQRKAMLKRLTIE